MPILKLTKRFFAAYWLTGVFLAAYWLSSVLLAAYWLQLYPIDTLLHPTSGYSEIHFYFEIHSEIAEIHVSGFNR